MMKIEDMKEKLRSIMEEKAIRKLSISDLEDSGIESKMLSMAEHVAIILISCSDGFAVNYAYMVEKRKPQFDWRFHRMNDKDLEVIGSIYKEKKKEIDVLESIYDSMKVRGIFEKAKALNS